MAILTEKIKRVFLFFKNLLPLIEKNVSQESQKHELLRVSQVHNIATSFDQMKHRI